MFENILFNRKEAAQYLGGICLTTLHRLNIPIIKIRNRVFYRKEDLNSWIEENIQNTGDNK
jgi:hypothetical protein